MPSYDRERAWSDVLERDAVLMDSLIARLPGVVVRSSKSGDRSGSGLVPPAGRGIGVVLGPRRRQREQQWQQRGIRGTSVAPPEGLSMAVGEVKSVVGVVSGAGRY